MESALDVLSRAATMVQNNASETRLTSKELPTAKWRRERRQRAAAAEYQVHDAGSDRERERERERDREPDMDSPIDMSVTSSTVKHQRASPPPPYREPQGGAASSHCYAASRPSVITQAPPKREQPEHVHHHHHSHSSREHDNRSTESVSICDIDEHFRRSLGPDYAALLKSPTSSSPTSSPQPQPQPQQQQQPSQPVVVASSGTPMQQISPQGYRQHQPTTYQQQHHSPLPLPLPLSKLGLSIVHSPTLHSAPVSPQHELPPPQEEPLSLTPPPVRAASASALTASSPPPQQLLHPSPLSATTSGASLILDMPVAKKERALDTPHHTPPRYNTPPPAYGSVLAPSTPTPTPPTMPAIIRVKAEPGLAAASSTHTPPASPTSSTNISIFTKTEASVDDHFAKALGDTWKKLQGQGKE
ncbi:proline-rich receptor-like protein kinase PERK8 [Drosophila grimshawi]|uniref:GH14822 n=1 Tax=Drosophila grimshawi TaxID=7222 RepID=B4J2Z2_DROGR|nr:proline-rich receptor-like protein kinase PERK8 [Drosophila grimshawi]EDV97162.1 GH14822 [Drosophila grimshawi]